MIITYSFKIIFFLSFIFSSSCLSCNSNYYQYSLSNYIQLGNSNSKLSMIGLSSFNEPGCLKSGEVFYPIQEFELVISLFISSPNGNFDLDGFVIWIGNQASTCDFNQKGGSFYYHLQSNLIIFEYDTYDNGNEGSFSMNIKSCLNNKICTSMDRPEDNNIIGPNLVSKYKLRINI